MAQAQKLVGAVIAMEVELNHLLDCGVVTDDRRDGPWREVSVTIGSQPVIAVLAGIGMVNAAAATEHLIAKYSPAYVVNSGCTGAHIASLMPGDVVIGNEVVYHAAMQILASGEERYTGFNFESVRGTVKANALPSDHGLLEIAHRVAKDTPLPAWPEKFAWPAQEPRRAPHILTGPVASADIWTQAIERIDLLHQRHGTLCEDMEAASIAQIAALHGVPYLTIKDISNNERHAQTNLIEDLAGFPMEEAGRRAAILLAAVIANLPA
jgi:adenosylhomocysteine nucleosidase